MIETTFPVPDLRFGDIYLLSFFVYLLNRIPKFRGAFLRRFTMMELNNDEFMQLMMRTTFSVLFSSLFRVSCLYWWQRDFSVMDFPIPFFGGFALMMLFFLIVIERNRFRELRKPFDVQAFLLGIGSVVAFSFFEILNLDKSYVHYDTYLLISGMMQFAFFFTMGFAFGVINRRTYFGIPRTVFLGGFFFIAVNLGGWYIDSVCNERGLVYDPKEAFFR